MPLPLRQPPFVLLDDSRTGHSLLYDEPAGLIVAETPAAVPDALAALDRALAEGQHAAGWIAYEAAAALDPALAWMAEAPQPEEPLIWLMLSGPPRRLDRHGLERLFREAMAGTARPFQIRTADPAAQQPAYEQAFDRLQAWIAAGDIYQANLTFPLAVDLAGDPVAAYAALRQAQPVPHGALIETGDWRVLSLSPELFVQASADRLLTRPMKGTAARDPLAESDRVARRALAADPKQRAENLMIVDLLRNDLSRVGDRVAVPDLFAVETYPSLHQMTSTVAARRRPDTSASDLIRALFPCGSVTGAPKLRAMACLAAVEARPRGLYTGAIGRFAPDSSLTLNVAIRTLVLDRTGAGRLGLGSGLVADSDKHTEWRECALKARFLTADPPPTSLIETLGWDPELGFVRAERHLARLTASADWFGWAACDIQAQAALDTLSQSLIGETRPMRIRLKADPSGRVAASAVPRPPLHAPVRLALAPQPLAAPAPLIVHKTDRRAHYEEPLAQARRSDPGLHDIVFCNAEGHLCEAARGSLFLQKGDCLLTPALGAGLLPGVLRAALLDEGQAQEATLTPEDLQHCDRIFWGNSLHGLVPACLVPLS